MKTRIALIITLLLAALTLTPPAFAQSNTSPINYCLAGLSYDLPDGWVADDLLRNQFGVATRLASSLSALGDSVPADGQAIVLVNIIARRAITEPLRLDLNTDIAALLENISTQTSAPDFNAGAIAPITVQGQPAASVQVHTQFADMIMYALDLNADTVGIVSISATPGAIDSWQSTAQAFLESLTLDAPRFPTTGANVVLGQSYATDDCGIAFAYPDGWTLTLLSPYGDPNFQAQLVNYDTPADPSGALGTGQAQIDLAVTLADISNPDALGYYGEQVSTRRGFEVITQQTVTLDNRPALVLDMRTPVEAEAQFDVTGIVIVYPNDFVVSLMLYTAPGERDQWRETALAVAGSLQVNLVTSE